MKENIFSLHFKLIYNENIKLCNEYLLVQLKSVPQQKEFLISARLFLISTVEGCVPNRMSMRTNVAVRIAL